MNRQKLLYLLVGLSLGLWFPVAAERTGALQAVANIAAPAASNNTIPVQLRLTDAAGKPLTGPQALTFRLYAVPTGGTAVWTEARTGATALQAVDGLISAKLGDVTPLPTNIANLPNLHLGVQVGTDPAELSPRIQLGSAPYAFVVSDGSVGTSKLVDNSVTQAKLAMRVPRLLGHKTCNLLTDTCNAIRETGLSGGWHVVKGATLSDPVRVTVSTTGGPLLVTMVSRYWFSPPASPTFCGIRVLSNGNQVSFAHIDGQELPYQIQSGAGAGGMGCSGSYVFGGLPAGTYVFEAVAYLPEPGLTVDWGSDRQIAVIEY